MIQSLRYTAGLDFATILQVEAIQKKRNRADYIRIGEVSDDLAAEARALAEQVSKTIRRWLAKTHPDLVLG